MTPAQMAEIHASAFVAQRPWSAREFADLLSSNLVFHATSSAHCFALGRVIAGEAELLTIATHPDYQRKGLARTCLVQFLNTCRERQADQVFLEVDSTNRGARTLYNAVGFQETGRRTGYYRHPDGTTSDAILMSLRLL